MKNKSFIILLVLILCGLGWYYINDEKSFGIADSEARGFTNTTVSKSKECPHVFATWNIQDLGKSKSEETLDEVADIILSINADVVAIQEVTAGAQFGVKAVAKIADNLSRKGEAWDYLVSDATTSNRSPSISERYGYLFRKSKIDINRGRSHLVEDLIGKVDREPFTTSITFKGEAPVTFFNFHAVPTAKKPINEIRHVVVSPLIANSTRAIFSGDLNLRHTATDSLFKSSGYDGHIQEKTSLMKALGKKGEYHSQQYDNIYTKGIVVCSSGVYDFVKEKHSPVTNESLHLAKKVSDHLPSYINFK